MFLFAFAQLRADNLRNDPQKCQETSQMTQVENTNHQRFKSIWRRVFNLSTFLWSLRCLPERYCVKLLQNIIKLNLIWQNVVKITWYLQTWKSCPEGRHDLKRQRRVLRTTNKTLNVIELLTTIKTLTKQTKNTSKIIDLRGPLKTADHCGAVLLFELNSLTYAFCSTSHV